MHSILFHRDLKSKIKEAIQIMEKLPDIGELDPREFERRNSKVFLEILDQIVAHSVNPEVGYYLKKVGDFAIMLYDSDEYYYLVGNYAAKEIKDRDITISQLPIWADR